jgi:uncharacterized RDD family membrane protein YckC
VRLPRAALRPAQAVARQGRTALTEEVERAIDSMLAGPLPEAVARSIVEHRVLERVVTAAELDKAVARALSSPAVHRAAVEAVDSPLTEELAMRIAQSAAFRHALRETLSSPELRSALMQQTTGFGAELADSLRRRARRIDDAENTALRRRLRRPAATASRFGGLVSRGIALVTDCALAHVAFLVLAASVGLVLALAGDVSPGWVEGAVAGGGWFAVVVAYFVTFWTATGQTPGMRVMRLRVATEAGGQVSVWRSLVRLVGLVLSVVSLGIGFLPVLVDGKRRALQDYLAGTVVRAE